MKKSIMTILIAFCIGNFAIAQTQQSAVKKSILMPDGSQVVDLKTGEVIRTNKGGISIDNLNFPGPIILHRVGGGAKNQGTNEDSNSNSGSKNTSNKLKNKTKKETPAKSNN